ncbi:unnamed protein product, partial [Prorocentrum cordatum]
PGAAPRSATTASWARSSPRRACCPTPRARRTPRGRTRRVPAWRALPGPCRRPRLRPTPSTSPQHCKAELRHPRSRLRLATRPRPRPSPAPWRLRRRPR